jgi:hypothetical protein
LSGGSLSKLGPYRLQARRAASSEAGAPASADCDRLTPRSAWRLRKLQIEIMFVSVVCPGIFNPSPISTCDVAQGHTVGRLHLRILFVEVAASASRPQLICFCVRHMAFISRLHNRELLVSPVSLFPGESRTPRNFLAPNLIEYRSRESTGDRAASR